MFIASKSRADELYRGIRSADNKYYILMHLAKCALGGYTSWNARIDSLIISESDKLAHLEKGVPNSVRLLVDEFADLIEHRMVSIRFIEDLFPWDMVDMAELV